MKIARVFPTKTSMSPNDPDSYFDTPDMFTPKYDEVHVSVVFTWDIDKAYKLAEAWRYYGKVKLGGPAVDGESDKLFRSGVYLKKGITITSRGCPNNCSFCMVRRGLIEFDDFPEGNIVQDNNILACSDRHRELVWSMLRKQKQVNFRGGLEAARVTSKIAEDLRALRIQELWLACDHPNAIKPLQKACDMLGRAGFTRSHLRCYVLIGKDMAEEENRLQQVWFAGCMPFAQLFIDRDGNKNYSKEWRRFQRKWARPAIIRSVMNHWQESKEVKE